MWFIWLVVFLAICLIGLIVVWIGNKVWISIKRDDRMFQEECEQTEERKNE